MDYEHRMCPFTERARSTYLYYLPAASFAFPPHSPSSIRGHRQLLELAEQIGLSFDFPLLGMHLLQVTIPFSPSLPPELCLDVTLPERLSMMT